MSDDFNAGVRAVAKMLGDRFPLFGMIEDFQAETLKLLRPEPAPIALSPLAMSLAHMVEEWYQQGGITHLPASVIQRRLNRLLPPLPAADSVEVCGICDIAGCHHIRERKIADPRNAAILEAISLVADRRNAQPPGRGDFKLLNDLMGDLDELRRRPAAASSDPEPSNICEASGKMHDITCLPDDANISVAREWAMEARALLRPAAEAAAVSAKPAPAADLRSRIDEELTKQVEHYRQRAAEGGPARGIDERMAAAAECARKAVLKLMDEGKA